MKELNIGDHLRSLRKAKNLTTNELADKVNISQSYISRFENNRAIPDIDMLDRILYALDTNLAAFFAYQQEQLPNDLLDLIESAKKLSPDERIKLNEFLKALKK